MAENYVEIKVFFQVYWLISTFWEYWVILWFLGEGEVSGSLAYQNDMFKGKSPWKLAGIILFFHVGTPRTLQGFHHVSTFARNEPNKDRQAKQVSAAMSLQNPKGKNQTKKQKKRREQNRPDQTKNKNKT